MKADSTRLSSKPESFRPAHLSELPDILTVVEVARVLRIGRNAAYEAIQRGQIPSLRFGRRVLVPKAALLAMIG
ncbi:MAG: helix-turn-helix domain-containing protein [Candidatus Binatia bacterium]